MLHRRRDALAPLLVWWSWPQLPELPQQGESSACQLSLPGMCPSSRWDIQRIREQRILQRLQLRMYKRKGIQESEPEVTSFFPEPDDGEALGQGGRQGCWWAGRGCVMLWCLPQWKVCSSPPTCLSSPSAGPYQN